MFATIGTGGAFLVRAPTSDLMISVAANTGVAVDENGGGIATAPAHYA
jgi:hypothetical protein